MKVAVITPYYKTPREWMEKCHQSVLQQTHPCTHIFVADGVPEDYVRSWNVQHIVLEKGHADFGDTPRAIGSLSAIAQNFDAIAYLDSDNWYHPQHIESLVKLHQETKASVCVSNRLFTRLDGSPMGECPFTHPDNFIDTSCYFLTKSAFRVAPLWSFIPKDYHPIDDRMMLLYIKDHKLSRAFTDQITVAYRTKHPGDYQVFGETIAYDSSSPGVYAFTKARELLFQRTGIDVKIRFVRPVRRYDGSFWGGE